MDGHLYERECDVDGCDESLAHVVPEEIVVERAARSHHGFRDQWSRDDLWKIAA